MTTLQQGWFSVTVLVVFLILAVVILFLGLTIDQERQNWIAACKAAEGTPVLCRNIRICLKKGGVIEIPEETK